MHALEDYRVFRITNRVSGARFLEADHRGDITRIQCLSLFTLVGALYYTHDDQKFLSVELPFDQKFTFSGVVVSDPTINNGAQQAFFELRPPLEGRVLIKLPPYPSFSYGDELEVRGVIERPFSEGYAGYLAKEGASGVTSYAQASFLKSDQASSVKASLFKIKHRMTDSFKRVLPQEEAAFLSGITLGGQSEFSKEFKEAMKLSGTTHIVALSGYNITIVVWVVLGMFTYFFSRKWSLVFTFIVIIGFVLLTGAEASTSVLAGRRV